MNFKVFEEIVFVGEPQGLLKKSAAVKRWEKIGVGKTGTGFGVYAIDDIKDNEIIEECPVLILPTDEIRGTQIMDIIYKLTDDIYGLAMGNGSIYNHRNQPNARWEYVESSNIIKIVSVRPIKSGEEIYINYGRDYFKSRNINMKK